MTEKNTGKPLDDKNGLRVNVYGKLEDVVPIVVEYQKRHADGKDVEGLMNLIMIQLRPYITNYPHFAFRKNDEDLKSDFFIYIYERFESVVRKYDPALGKFSTYLSIKLKHHFFNYMRRLKSRNKIRVSTYTLDSTIETVSRDEDDVLLKVAENESYMNEKKIKKDLFKEVEGDLFRFLCIKLYYIDFFEDDDFSKLVLYLDFKSEKLKDSLHDEVSNLQDEIFKKKKTKLYYELCLNKIYQQRLERQNKIISLDNQADLAELLEKQKKVSDRKESLLNRYHAVNIFPSMKSVADIMRSEPNKISNVINYYKKYLKRKSENNAYY